MAINSSNQELGINIGKTIAKYRIQAQVAEILDISNDEVSRMEQGIIMSTTLKEA